jgi:hypothetical protein
MVDIARTQNDLTKELNDFELQVRAVYNDIVRPHWDSSLEWQRLPGVLYGCMMWCFAHIDLYSSYWKGNSSSQGQAIRMIDFMEQYLGKSHRASSVAFQIWRNKLMHTGAPRRLHGQNTSKVYGWLLHWGDMLPKDQHFTFSESGNLANLNMALFYLVDDLKDGLQKYLSALAVDEHLRENFEKVEAELEKLSLKDY